LDWSIVAFQGWERGCIGGESWSFQDRDGILEVRQKQFHFFLLLTHFLFLLSVSVAFRSQDGAFFGVALGWNEAFAQELLEIFKIPKVFLYQLSPYLFFNLEIWLVYIQVPYSQLLV
jgi:hypothetical protein